MQRALAYVAIGLSIGCVIIGFLSLLQHASKHVFCVTPGERLVIAPTERFCIERDYIIKPRHEWFASAYGSHSETQR